MGTNPELGRAVLELSTDSTKYFADLDKAKAGAKDLGNNFSSLKGTLSSLNGVLGAFGVALSAGAIVQFGKSLLDMADEITRVADRTGLTTDEVQRMTFAAEQSGNTLDELTGAIGAMQNRLASGDSSALAALDKIGVKFDDLAKMGPEQQFAAIAKAIGGIKNPAEQAAIAQDLFGKAGIAILPTLKAHYDDLAKAAPVASARVIASLDQLGDALAGIGTQIKVWAANSYEAAGTFFDRLIATVYRAIGGLYKATASLVDLAAKIPGSSKVFGDLAGQADALRQSATWYADAAQGMREQTERATVAVSSAAKGFPPLTRVVKEHTTAVKAAKKAHEAFGLSVDNAEYGIRPIIKQLGEQIEITSRQFADFGYQLQVVEGIAAHAKIGTDIGLPEIPTIAPRLFDDFTKAIRTQLGPAIIGAFQGGGDVVKSVGGFLGNELGKSLIGDGTKGLGGWLTKHLGKTLGGVFSSLIPGLGTLLGPLASAIGKFFGGLFGNATKSAINDAFGSYDALRAKINTLTGDARVLGDELWIQLTQRTGKNDKAGAAALIQRITELLDEQKQKQAEVAQAAEESATTQTAAAQRITEAIQGIDTEMQSLADSIKDEAPEEEMGVVEKLTRERMARLADERKVLEAQLQAEQEATQSGVETVGDAVVDLGTALRNTAHDWETFWGAAKGGGVQLPVPGAIPMAEGGMGRVTAPTLFYSRGHEDFAFSGEGRSFRGGLQGPASQTIIAKLGERELFRAVLQGFPQYAFVNGVGA